MKKIFILAVAILSLSTTICAQNYFGSLNNSTRKTSQVGSRYQNGYNRSNGTYVNGHFKTRKNNTNWDNFSTSGNINPFTNSRGSVARDYSSQAYNYGNGRTVRTGSRGGQYYINSNGNKTYVPKRITRNSYGW